MTCDWSDGQRGAAPRGPRRTPRAAPPPRRCAHAPRIAPRSPRRRRRALVVHGRAAQRVDRPVVDDAQHPGAHRSAGAVVAGPRPPHRQERVLHDVLGGAAGAHHAVGEREGSGRVALVDELERARVAATHELHQVLVGQRVQVAPHRVVCGPGPLADHRASRGTRAAPPGRRRAACARRGPAGCARARGAGGDGRACAARRGRRPPRSR